jgi:surfactin synthase thioesterase subunit
MAAGITDAIAGSASRAPFVLYGHSLGAVVAFETALLLQRTGRTAGPIHLFVGAARGPHLPPPVPAISHLPQDEFLDAVQHRYGGLPAALFEEPELLELVLPILRSDFRAYENYLYTGSLATGSLALACPVTAFHGANDPIVRSADVSEWSRMTATGFKMEVVEGDHFFLNTHRDVLLAHVRPEGGYWSHYPFLKLHEDPQVRSKSTPEVAKE